VLKQATVVAAVGIAIMLLSSVGHAGDGDQEKRKEFLEHLLETFRSEAKGEEPKRHTWPSVRLQRTSDQAIEVPARWACARSQP